MSYRPGVYVIDRRSGRLGRVVADTGFHLHLEPPRGVGNAWQCPPDQSRLATEQERRAAGVTANGTVREAT